MCDVCYSSSDAICKWFMQYFHSEKSINNIYCPAHREDVCVYDVLPAGSTKHPIEFVPYAPNHKHTVTETNRLGFSLQYKHKTENINVFAENWNIRHQIEMDHLLLPEDLREII